MVTKLSFFCQQYLNCSHAFFCCAVTECFTKIYWKLGQKCKARQLNSDWAVDSVVTIATRQNEKLCLFGFRRGVKQRWSHNACDVTLAKKNQQLLRFMKNCALQRVKTLQVQFYRSFLNVSSVFQAASRTSSAKKKFLCLPSSFLYQRQGHNKGWKSCFSCKNWWLWNNLQTFVSLSTVRWRYCEANTQVSHSDSKLGVVVGSFHQSNFMINLIYGSHALCVFKILIVFGVWQRSLSRHMAASKWSLTISVDFHV